MSDINPLYTAQAKTAAPGQGAAGQAALGKGHGLFGAAGAGLNFFDLIFARMMDGQNPSSDGTPPSLITPQNALTGQTESTENGAVLDPAALSATDIFPVQEGIAIASEEESATSSLNAKGQSAVLAALENLLRGLPQEYQDTKLKIAPGQAQKLAKALETIQNGEQQDSQAAQSLLIATGLSPQKLTDLMAQIAETASDEENALFLVGLMKLLPDGAKNEAIFLPRALIMSKSVQTADGINEPNEDLAASLNALTVNMPQDNAAMTSGLPVPADAMETGSDILAQIQARGGNDIQTLPSVPSNGEMAAGTKTGVNASQPAPGPLNSTFSPGFAGLAGSMTEGGFGEFLEGMDWQQTAHGSIGSAPAGTSQMMTNLITQTQHASQSHPATQIVAVSLVRAGQAGEDQTLRLRLDPPELGRIEVHMHFTKDKTMKAHMVIEKLETMLMLQRDAQVLERALAEAGMETGGNALSFSLSDQNSMSGDGDHHHGDRSANDKHAEADGDIEIIETTMTWYVDEKTGIQRYNLLA